MKEVVSGLILVVLLHASSLDRSGDTFLMEPESQTYQVPKAGQATLTCYSTDGGNISPVRWLRGYRYVCRTNFTLEKDGKCTFTYGPNNDYTGGVTFCFCNRSASTVVIKGVMQDDAKNWTCVSDALQQGKYTKLSLLGTGQGRDSTQGPAATFTTSFPLPTTSRKGWKATSSMSPSSARGVSATPGLSSHTDLQSTFTPRSVLSTWNTSPIAGPSDDSTFPPSSKTTRSVQNATMIYIIVGGVIGGIALLAIVVAIVMKIRTFKSGSERQTRSLVKKETTSSGDTELVMEENSIYWSNLPDNTTKDNRVQEADPAVTDVYSVVQKKKKGDNSDIYAKPMKKGNNPAKDAQAYAMSTKNEN